MAKKRITPQQKPRVKQAKITEKAHELTPELCQIYAREKGVTYVSKIDAVSYAVEEAIQRRTAMVPA